MLCGHDGEAVLGQMLAEQRVELLQLRGIRQVLHVHAQTLGHIKILLLQLLLTGFHAVDECLLLV